MSRLTQCFTSHELHVRMMRIRDHWRQLCGSRVNEITRRISRMQRSTNAAPDNTSSDRRRRYLRRASLEIRVAEGDGGPGGSHLCPVIASRRRRRPRHSCVTLNRISASRVGAVSPRRSAADAASVTSSRHLCIILDRIESSFRCGTIMSFDLLTF